MKVTIHQPNYLPYLGYFHKMAQCDVFVLLDDVQFMKRSYTQRVKIKAASGDLWLTIPVFTKNRRSQIINEVEIDTTQPWERKHWKTLVQSYNKARYFSVYSEFFEAVYESKHQNLGEFNEHMILKLAAELDIHTRLIKASSLGVSGVRTEKIIGICKALGGDIYLSGTSGVHYLEEEKFHEAGIRLEYQEFQHPIYPQLHGGFEPNLSVVDLLFNCGRESKYYLPSESNS